jgi:hypothetical protein
VGNGRFAVAALIHACGLVRREPRSLISKRRMSPAREPRFIEEGSLAHRTLADRMAGDENYRPFNLPAALLDENGAPMTPRP